MRQWQVGASLRRLNIARASFRGWTLLAATQILLNHHVMVPTVEEELPISISAVRARLPERPSSDSSGHSRPDRRHGHVARILPYQPPFLWGGLATSPLPMPVQHVMNNFSPYQGFPDSTCTHKVRPYRIVGCTRSTRTAHRVESPLWVPLIYAQYTA